MQTKRGVMIRLMALLLAVAFVGCGTNSITGNGDTSGSVSEMAINLADPYGGLDSNDEEPAFGESYFAFTLTEDEPVVTGEERITDEGATVLFLRAVWGRVSEAPESNEAASTECDSVNWDGGLSTSDGWIRPVSTIRFERRGSYADKLVLPRNDRSVLEWTSVTGCGRDGVVIALIVPPVGDTLGNGDGLTGDDAVSFETGPLTISFRLSEIPDLDSLVMIDGESGVAFTGFAKDDMDAVCRRGRVVGLWHEAREDSVDGGYFRAAWLNPVGALFGHVRGRYGIYDGAPVFRGKIINRNGGYEGHITGTWDAKNPRGGSFRGRWVVVHPDRDPLYVGGTHGRWHVGRGGNGGWMHGRWSTKCNDYVADGDGNGGGHGHGH